MLGMLPGGGSDGAKPTLSTVQGDALFCPAVPAAFHPPFRLFLSESAIWCPSRSHPACVAQAEARYRISFDRSRQKRGLLPEPFPVLARETTSCRKESCACALHRTSAMEESVNAPRQIFAFYVSHAALRLRFALRRQSICFAQRSYHRPVGSSRPQCIGRGFARRPRMFARARPRFGGALPFSLSSGWAVSVTSIRLGSADAYPRLDVVDRGCVRSSGYAVCRRPRTRWLRVNADALLLENGPQVRSLAPSRKPEVEDLLTSGVTFSTWRFWCPGVSLPILAANPAFSRRPLLWAARASLSTARELSRTAFIGRWASPRMTMPPVWWQTAVRPEM